VATTPTRASAAEAALHWTLAGAVGLLLATGLVMYVPALSQLVQQRFWVRSAHLAAAVVTALAPLAFVALRPRETRRLERQLSVWSAADVRWFAQPLRVLGAGAREAGAPADPAQIGSSRFNGGQKLFAALLALGLAILLLTGVPMYWWAWFSASVVARARDLHVVGAFAVTALLLGHVYLGLFSPFGLGQSWIYRRRG
jgi:formate dehydrogenase subunit gamma